MTHLWLDLVLIVFLSSEIGCSNIIGIDFSTGEADGVNVTTKSGFDLENGN
jgi:hypothetical protein